MQLVAYGAQDIYLTGNPQITFFKVVFRRHTNFSIESIKQTLNGDGSIDEKTYTSTIARNGDLLTNLWFDVKLYSNGTNDEGGAAGDTADARDEEHYIAWTNNTGHALIKEYELEIGGQLIDRHYSQWLDIWNELTDHDESEWLGLNKNISKNRYLTSNHTVMNNLQLYIPLKLWFCRNIGLSLPLIALQYHEIKLRFTTRNLNACVNSDNRIALINDNSKPDIELWGDYIYLDTDERRRFAQVSHEYLIEQIQSNQFNINSTSMATLELNLNHPVKELIWVSQTNECTTENISTDGNIDATQNIGGRSGTISGNSNNDYFHYANDGGTESEENISGVLSAESFSKMNIIFNGHERFEKRKASYFRLCQPIQAKHKVPTKHIYCYSFALEPQEQQPSGSCNFSRIDSALMQFNNIASGTITVYAINYNVLRIMSGMGGLAYSN